ncbi:MAG: helix-hairpin-helix domain-containing protein, partial [Candidatus Omnitrophota bacterium]
HKVDLISIGNGTASRETDRLVGDLFKACPEIKAGKVVVSEAGASVYSASELASAELPSLDVTLRGAVSIARRLQDPLAELVKIDPKSIGVGQYQHDVNPYRLEKMLKAVVEDCVNAVGVEANTASPSLLSYVSGLTRSIAEKIVAYRNQYGSFKTREDFKKITGFGLKTFEQAAGFLRILDGDNPLDRSAVHPESYPLVQKILDRNKLDLQKLMGNHSFLSDLNPDDYADETFGAPTIEDILSELEKPGRDPRPEFKTASFNATVTEISHLKAGMVLEGTITNVVNFGAFVDIGVHQDGLVHISELSNEYVRNVHTIVRTGQIVRVKVLEIEPSRGRIALSMKLKKS